MESNDHYYVSPGDTPTFIVRHEVGLSTEDIQEKLKQKKKTLGISLENLPKLPANLSSIAGLCRDLIGLTHFSEPDSPDLAGYLRCMARAIGADAARHAPGNEPIVVDLGHGPVELARAEPKPSSSARLSRVIDGYHAALSARDKVALDLLTQAPLQALYDLKPSIESKTFVLPHALGLQALMAKNAKGIELLIEALRGCNSQEIDPEIANLAMFVDSPAIELALRFSEREDVAAAKGVMTVDAALRRGLTYFRHYWRDFRPNGDDRHTDPHGFVALGLLGWASMRSDFGLQVGIRSDYLPRSIVEGRHIAA